MYSALMDKGWTMPEIDGMDLCFYLRCIGHRPTAAPSPAKHAVQARGEGLYIDEFGLF